MRITPMTMTKKERLQDRGITENPATSLAVLSTDKQTDRQKEVRKTSSQNMKRHLRMLQGYER
jgi:hypothetical protein